MRVHDPTVIDESSTNGIIVLNFQPNERGAEPVELILSPKDGLTLCRMLRTNFVKKDHPYHKMMKAIDEILDA